MTNTTNSSSTTTTTPSSHHPHLSTKAMGKTVDREADMEADNVPQCPRDQHPQPEAILAEVVGHQAGDDEADKIFERVVESFLEGDDRVGPQITHVLRFLGIHGAVGEG